MLNFRTPLADSTQALLCSFYSLAFYAAFGSSLHAAPPEDSNEMAPPVDLDPQENEAPEDSPAPEEAPELRPEPIAPPPSGIAGKQAPASSGVTELAGQGSFATAPSEIDPSKVEDATELSLSAGGMLATGNARSAAITGLTDFRLRRKIHQLNAKLAGNYGAAAIEDSESLEQTVGNVQGRLRYDVFFQKRWSAFFMSTGRHDPFQGLQMRMNLDPGFAFYAKTEKDHRLWFEAGYDFQYDIRTQDAIDEASAAMPPVALEKTKTNHAGRIFAGYTNQIGESLALSTGFEYLQSLLESKTFRFNWDTAVTAQLINRFSLAFTFTLRYENQPLPEVRRLDTISAVNLVYRF